MVDRRYLVKFVHKPDGRVFDAWDSDPQASVAYERTRVAVLHRLRWEDLAYVWSGWITLRS